MEAEFVSAINRTDYPVPIPQQQIDTLGRRIKTMGPRAAVRRIRLKFLEHKVITDDLSS